MYKGESMYKDEVFFALVSSASINLLKVNHEKTRTIREICSKLTIKTPERCQYRRSDVFIGNFEQISQIVLVFPLLTLNK